MSPQQGQLRIAAPKPVYSPLHHRSFVLQDVRVEGELSPSGEPNEPERSGEPVTRTSSFSASSASTEPAFQQPPGSFQQLPVLPLSQQSQQPRMIKSHPPTQPSPSLISARTHHSAASSFGKSRIGSKTPPALFNPDSSSTRQGQIKAQFLGYPAPSPPLSGGRPLPAVPLASQDSTSSSPSLNTNASHPSMNPKPGFDTSASPRSSASHGSSISSASSKSPHTHLSLSTPSSLISTASGSSTVFPVSSDIMTSDGDNASNPNNNGGRQGSNTIHGTHAQRSHVQSTQGAQGVTYSYAFHQDQNQSTSSSSSSVLLGSAAPAFVSLPPPLSSPPPPPMVAMASGSGPMASTTTKSGGESVSRDRKGSNPNTSNAANSNSAKINSSTNNNTALVRPLPLPPGSTPRARTRSNNVLGGPPGSHTSSVNVLALPISWASRPVDLNRSVPASSGVNASHAGHSGGEHQHQHQQHTLQQHQQPGQQIQQGQQKTYSRPPSRPSLRSHPSSRPSSRPSSPSAPSPPSRPPSNLAFGPGSSTASSTSTGAGAVTVGAGRPSSPPPRSKTITSTTRSTARGGRLRSRSTSRPKTQVSAGAGAGVLRYESFSGASVAMGTPPAMTSPTVTPPNTAPLQARPQGSRTIPSPRKRSATESSDGPSNVVITKSQPLGSGLTTTTPQPMARQAPKRSAIPPRSTPPQSQLPSPPSISHHHGVSHGHASSSGLTPGHNTSLLAPLSTAAPPTTQNAQSSGSKRHQGGVQLSRQLVSRAAAVPAPLNQNYNYVPARGGVYYVRDNDPYPYHQRRQDEKGKTSETNTTTLVSKNTLPVRPLPKPGVLHPLASDKQSAEEDVDADAEDGGKPSVDDDDGISCLSYIDSPDSGIGVHPDLGSLSFAEDDDMMLSDGEREDPILVYIDDNFDSSDEGEQFAKSVSPMRYARPGSDGSVDSGDDGGSDMSSDFFSDVDDPFKYNKGRSKRRGRTRNTVPVGISDETAVGAGGSQSHDDTKAKPGIRMTGSLGSMRDLIESKAVKEKRKKEADVADGGAIATRTKSAERDRALPQRYGHPQESPLPPPPPRLTWLNQPQGGEGGSDKMISPVSLSSSQGGRSLSPMRYAKRMSLELLDDSSSLGSPISPIAGVGGLLKGAHAKSASGKRKKRTQPWSYQFDYQAAKASSPFTFGMGGEKATIAVDEKREEEKRKVEEEKKREKAKSLRGFKTKEVSEGKKKLSIDVLDISLLRRSSQPTLLEPGTGGDDVFGLGSGGSGGSGGGGGGGGGSGGSGQQTFRTWDDSPASSATASSFTVIAAAASDRPGTNTPPAHSPPPSTSSPPAASSVGRTRTFKVRNP